MGESGHVARGRVGVLREDPDAGEEIEGMDRGKVGAPYRYAESPFMRVQRRKSRGTTARRPTAGSHRGSRGSRCA